MHHQYILSEYIENAMDYAEFEKQKDGTYIGKISICKGVEAMAETLADVNDILRENLEDWILHGLKLRRKLPVINGINLNINIDTDLNEDL